MRFVHEVDRGACLPYGYSRVTSRYGSRTHYVMFPLFAAPMCRYDICRDAKREGWWAFNILLKKEGPALTLSWGWSLLKETGEPIHREW